MELSVGEASRGEDHLFVGIVRDITAPKQAKSALRYSEARLRSIIDTDPDAVVTIDALGQIDSFSPSAERLFVRLGDWPQCQRSHALALSP